MSDLDLNKAELALHHLVTAAIDHRLRVDAERKASGEQRPLRAYTFEEVVSTSFADSELHDLIEDPVGASLRLGIKKVGKMLYRHGGTEAMQKVLERVAARDDSRYSYRADIMDKNWDGIGSENDFWAS